MPVPATSVAVVKNLYSVLAFAALLVACDGEEAPGPSGDAGVDAAGVVDCEGIDLASTVGGPCASDLDCALGAQCSVLGDDAALGSGLCRQQCAPGVCDEVCAETEVCVPLEGAPSFGVCAALAAGTRGNYETCSDEVGRCLDGLSCLVARTGDEEGVCLQPCDEGLPCPTWEGVRGRCVIDVEDLSGPRRFCAPECPELGADVLCPGAMTCEEAGFLTVCAFGQP